MNAIRIGQINRRDFLKVILTTVSAVALERPGSLWPESDRGRFVSEPIRVGLTDEGYLYDPEKDFGDLPTYRAYLEYDSLDSDRKRDALLELWRMVRHEDFEDREIDEDSEEDEEQVLEELASWHLDDEVDLECLSTHDGALLSEYAMGIEIYEALPIDTARHRGTRR